MHARWVIGVPLMLLVGAGSVVAAWSRPSTGIRPPAAAAQEQAFPSVADDAGTIEGMVVLDCSNSPDAGSGCQGQGIADAVVDIYYRDGTLYQRITTAADGGFRVTVPPGPYLVEVQPTYAYQGAQQQVTIEAGSTVSVTLAVRR